MMAHQDNLDHRSSDFDAHTSMTIEFLRAHLLAERAVSKNARAKLNGLSDKVAELEEQLKIVSLQRKKAEQATADVLAILEENGFTDVSDASDSNSDQESYSQTNSVSGKSLSWKGRMREPCSSDKIKESRNRRHRGFESAYFSSPRHRQGRSCRQIKRSESRIVSEDYKRDGNPVDLQENGVHTENLPQLSEEASRTMIDGTVVKRDNLKKNLISSGLEKENSMDINLERALEQRALVIGAFGDMEETHKEWEKKFRENKSSPMDLCDVGNHSDVTDAESFETFSRGSPDNSVTSPEKCCKSCGSKSMEQDASPSGDKEKHISHSLRSVFSHPRSSNGIPEHSRGDSFCSSATINQKEGYPLVPMIKEKFDTCDNVLTALQQAKLSLKEKVNSLQIRKHEYHSESSYPSPGGSYMNTYALPIKPAFGTKSSFPASSVGSMLEFPVGCAGLFRVPTDFSPDASTRNNFLASSSQKALVSHIPERDMPMLPGDQLSTNTSTKNFLKAPLLSMEDRPLTTPYINGPKLWAGFRADGQPIVDTQESRLYKGTSSGSCSGISSGTSGFEGKQFSSTSFYLDRQVSTYTPMTPTPSLYPDLVMRSKEMYSTPYYTRPVGLPPTGGSDDNLFRRV